MGCGGGGERRDAALRRCGLRLRDGATGFAYVNTDVGKANF